MISLRALHGSPTSVKSDLLACFVFEDPPLKKRQIRSLLSTVRGLGPQLQAAGFNGKDGETLLLYPQGTQATRLILVGLGKSRIFSREVLRRASARAAKYARDHKAVFPALLEPDPAILPPSDFGHRQAENIALAMAEGVLLSLYKFDKYLSHKDGRESRIRRIVLVSADPRRALLMRSGVNVARTLCDATYLARDLSNSPGNEIFPQSLAAEAKRVGRRNGVRVTVFDRNKIKRLGMGGLIGVSLGSARPPCFIIMEYGARKLRVPTIALVGKGVTFDSGGISIKPSANMAEMKMDMAGSAAVIGTMQAAAQLNLPLHLVGLIPATENMPGGSSLKPGDILRHHNGKTSEVDNTDAEGRLILADALSYATRFKPEVVIDLATLTGACVVALGHVATGMMGNDQQTMDRLKASGETTFERVWQLPLFEEYDKLIKSDVADVKNVGGRWAGAITAALFLRRFIGEYRWVHLDIAGTAIQEEDQDYCPKGGSGVGVRLLTHFLQNWDRGDR